jgi:hypothetical protein
MFEKVIGRFSRLLNTVINPFGSKIDIPEDVENNHRLHEFMNEMLYNMLGVSSHEIEGVERLKYQIRKDMILWVVTRQRKTKYDYVHDYGTKINHQINILY